MALLARNISSINITLIGESLVIKDLVTRPVSGSQTGQVILTQVGKIFGKPTTAALLFANIVFTLYLFAALLVFSYSEMRFFATATPMFYCCLPWVMAQSKTSLMPFYLCLIIISFYVMMAAGYREAQLDLMKCLELSR